MAYVTVEGKQIEVKDQALDLSCMYIEQLSQIKGLQTLNQLESLDLSHNHLGPDHPHLGLFKPNLPLSFLENMNWKQSKTLGSLIQPY